MTAMTRYERKRQELDNLFRRRKAAMARCDAVWLGANRERIAALEREVAEMEEAMRPQSLHALLKESPDDVRNRMLMHMLRISLLADVVNEACEICRDDFRNTFGVQDFSLRAEVDEMAKLSAKIAKFMLCTGNGILEDTLVDNAKFVDMCITHANAHLKRKLKLK